MVLGGAPDAKLDAVRRHLLLVRLLDPVRLLPDRPLRRPGDVELVRRRPTLDNDGMDAASQEADVIHARFGDQTTPMFSTGNGAPGFGTVTAPSPVFGIQVGASTQFGGTGWDSIANYSQVTDNDVIEWSNRGPGANGAQRRRRRRRRLLLARRRDAEHDHRRPERVGDVGRHQPLDAGRRRRDRAHLAGVQAGARRRSPNAADRQDDPEVVGEGPRLRRATSRARARSTPARRSQAAPARARRCRRTSGGRRRPGCGTRRCSRR